MKRELQTYDNENHSHIKCNERKESSDKHERNRTKEQASVASFSKRNESERSELE